MGPFFTLVTKGMKDSSPNLWSRSFPRMTEWTRGLKIHDRKNHNWPCLQYEVSCQQFHRCLFCNGGLWENCFWGAGEFGYWKNWKQGWALIFYPILKVHSWFMWYQETHPWGVLHLWLCLVSPHVTKCAKPSIFTQNINHVVYNDSGRLSVRLLWFFFILISHRGFKKQVSSFLILRKAKMLSVALWVTSWLQHLILC